MLTFPFSDLSQNKLRPGVILAEAGRGDWVVCQITSNPFGDKRSFPLTNEDFATGALSHTSYVRPGKVFTANESLMRTVAGTLKPEMLEIIRESVIAIIQER